jgi:hypothetical protein
MYRMTAERGHVRHRAMEQREIRKSRMTQDLPTDAEIA